MAHQTGYQGTEYDGAAEFGFEAGTQGFIARNDLLDRLNQCAPLVVEYEGSFISVK